MSDLQSLRGKLSKLIHESVSIDCGWRQITASDESNLTTAVIDELDETLFPRRLTLRNDDGQILCLEAANRRLRRFIPPAPFDVHSALFEADLSDPRNEVVDQIVAFLEMFLAGSSVVMLHSTDIPGHTESAQAGISAQDLQMHWSGEFAAPSDSESAMAVQEFQSELSGNCAFWVSLIEGQVDSTSDPNCDPDLLTELAQTNWETVFPTPQEAPRCCALGHSDSEFAEIVIVSHNNRVYFARNVSLKPAKIGELWRRSFG